MKSILILILTISTLSCKENKLAKVENSKKTDSIHQTVSNSEKPELKKDSTKKVDVGFYDRFEKLPKLTFEIITEQEFMSVAEKKYIDTSKPQQNDDLFKPL